MTKSDDVGEVPADGETTLRWTIPRYMQTPQEVDTLLWSPRFLFRGAGGCEFRVYPNGSGYREGEGWTGIRCRIPSLPPATTVTCCAVGSEGRKIQHSEMERDGAWYNQLKWIRRRELEAWSEEILPGGTLRVVVRVVLPDERGHRAEEEEESDSEVSVTSSEESTGIESHAQNNEGAETGVTGFSGSSVSVCTRRHIDNGLEQLSENLTDLYLQGKGCDLILRVREKEYRAHRSILRARIPAFDTKFENDIVVSIQDCDPEIFEHFLLYIYSGRLDNLSRENVLGLSNLARRYGLRHLRNACIKLLRRSHPIKKNNIIILAP